METSIKTETKTPAINILNQVLNIKAELIMALVLGVSTNFTPYHLYNYMGFADFPLHLVYVGGGSFILSIIVALRSPGGEMVSTGFLFSCVYHGTIIGIIIGLFMDPTSHNLWPFEVVMNFIYGLPIVIGAGLVYGFRSLKNK